MLPQKIDPPCHAFAVLFNLKWIDSSQASPTEQNQASAGGSVSDKEHSCSLFTSTWAWYLAIILPFIDTWTQLPWSYTFVTARDIVPLIYIFFLSTAATDISWPSRWLCGVLRVQRVAVLRVLQALMVASFIAHAAMALIKRGEYHDPTKDCPHTTPADPKQQPGSSTGTLYAMHWGMAAAYWLVKVALCVWHWFLMKSAFSAAFTPTVANMRALLSKLRDNVFGAGVVMSSIVDFCAVSGGIMIAAVDASQSGVFFSVSYFIVGAASFFMSLWLKLSLAWMPQTFARFAAPLDPALLAGAAAAKTACDGEPEAATPLLQTMHHMIKSIMWLWLRSFVFWFVFVTALYILFGLNINTFALWPADLTVDQRTYCGDLITSITSAASLLMLFWLVPGPGLWHALRNVWAWQLLQQLQKKELKCPKDLAELAWCEKVSATAWVDDMQAFSDANHDASRRSERMFRVTEMLRLFFILFGLHMAGQLNCWQDELKGNTLTQLKGVASVLPGLASLVIKPLRDKWKLLEKTVMHASYATALQQIIEAEVENQPYQVVTHDRFYWRFYFGVSRIWKMTQDQREACARLLADIAHMPPGEEAKDLRRRQVVWKTYELIRTGTAAFDVCSTSTAYVW